MILPGYFATASTYSTITTLLAPSPPKPAAELGLEPSSTRRKGKIIFLKVIPDTLSTRAEFVYKKHMIVSQDDVQLNRGRVFVDYFLTALNKYDYKDEAAHTTCSSKTLQQVLNAAPQRIVGRSRTLLLTNRRKFHPSDAAKDSGPNVRLRVALKPLCSRRSGN